MGIILRNLSILFGKFKTTNFSLIKFRPYLRIFCSGITRNKTIQLYQINKYYITILYLLVLNRISIIKLI